MTKGEIDMKVHFRTAAAVILAFASLIGFASCSKTPETTTTESYVYHPADETTTSSDKENSPAGSDALNVDPSWKANFDVSYTYFNKSQSEDAIRVHEKRSEKYFSAEDIDSGDTLYYKENGKNIDSYVIVPGGEEQVHSVIDGKKLNDLSSTFMKLSDVDPDLPVLANVMYMYDEDVAGRACSKYIQRAYADGEATGTVYVWVDAEYGFAAKGEVYDANTVLTASWEVTSFAAGAVKDADVEMDLSSYKIVEG